MTDNAADAEKPGEAAGKGILESAGSFKPDISLIRFLLEREAPDLTLLDKNSKTALMHFSSGGEIALMKDFIEGGAQVNQKGASGNTALHIAAASGNEPAIELYLANGGNAAGRNDDGMTPLDLAKGKVGPTLLAALEKKFAEQDPSSIRRREISDFISEQGLRTAETVEAPARAAFRPRVK